MGSNASISGLIDRTSTREFFAELVGVAARDAEQAPSPIAEMYLVELLAERVAALDPDEPSTLAEAWLDIQSAPRPQRVRGLRTLGDRALFVSGFFGEGLLRSVVGLSYYRDMGRLAYASLARLIGDEGQERAWPELFEELADCFPALVALLADVSDRANAANSPTLLATYDHFLATGSARARRRLTLAGVAVAHAAGKGRVQ